MSFIVGICLGFGSGLIVGWVVLPEPAFVRRFFVRIGWAKERV
jgi:hypothetical protein